MDSLFHVWDRSINRLDRMISRLQIIVCGDTVRLMPATIDALGAIIEEFIRVLPADMLERVCQNWNQNMNHLRHSRGHLLHEIIFKH